MWPRRLTDAQRDALANPPRTLIDPDGEGVYVLGADALKGATSLLGHYSRWRDIDAEYVVMGPDGDGESWRRVPRERGLLFRRRGYRYGYYTPKPDADPPGPSAEHLRMRRAATDAAEPNLRDVVRRLERIEAALSASGGESA